MTHFIITIEDSAGVDQYESESSDMDEALMESGACVALGSRDEGEVIIRIRSES